VTSQPTGLYIKGDSHLGQFEINARLIGSFNAENVLIVLGMLLSSGVSLANAIERLSMVQAPPGRMEMFEMPNGPVIVVDYAHTPDALEKALNALRQHIRGQLYCVFGCGGDRDAGKRPAMARVAATYADHVVVTDDNPRTEDPDAIVAMICAGLPVASSVMIERNREQAIRQAVRRAGAGDMVLVAGKGHEEVQIIGDTAIHFSDRQVAAHLIREAA
jgi:UDP-N-acetylmuramoyl-L-alanyl-D-glutamate--2,6-diaminopimelate ligase